MEPFVRLFAGIKNPKEYQKALRFLVSVDYKRTAFQFSLLGADNVVRSFNELMQYIYSIETIEEEKFDPGRFLQLWGAFLLEIRRDVGNKKTKLGPADMLRIQITDIDKFIK